MEVFDHQKTFYLFLFSIRMSSATRI